MRTSGSKFGNHAGHCLLGHSHRSKLESYLCALLQLRQKAGEFNRLIVEKRVKVCCSALCACTSQQRVDYIADFFCERDDGGSFYVEAKGVATAIWKIKRRLWIHNVPFKLEVWGGHYSRPTLIEVINA